MSELQEVRQKISSAEQKISLVEEKADAAERVGDTQLFLAYQQQLVSLRAELVLLREKEERKDKEAATGGEICAGTHAATIAQTQLPLFHRYTPH
jgi:predicted  nucleic acid-binding Zn-ribbon protein